jgi:hypothetical protein
VGLLDNFERRLDDIVNGPFQRVFKDVVEPVEIAARVTQEMDRRAAIMSRGRTVVPNVFAVELSTHDFERLQELLDAIRFELMTVARQHATDQRYTFTGNVQVDVTEDPALDTGVFKIHSATKADASPPPQPPAAGPLPTDAQVGHPRLIVAGTTHQLTKAQTRLGRGTGIDINVNDPGVSRTHAEIVLGNPPIVRDLGSTNGTAVDGRKVAESPLHDGAQITIGGTTMTFRSG